MFYGNEELCFTPEEAELIAEAEGRVSPRRTPRLQRRVPVERPPTGGGGGTGILIGIALAAVLAAGLAKSPEASKASAETRETETLRQPASRSSAQIDRRSETGQPENLLASGVARSEAQDPAGSVSAQDLLPSGWERTAFSQETTLLANPWHGAHMVGLIPARTELLIRITPAAGTCSRGAPPQGMTGYVWHAAILASGTACGYICAAFPESIDPNIRRPLPPGWIRRIYGGDGPATLRYPNGQILPGTEVVMRATGNHPNEFFVMSANGLSWGFGQFEEGASLADDEGPQFATRTGVVQHEAELPPGWESIVLSADTPLYENASSDSRIVGTLPAGTAMLIRNIWQCWHGAVTEKGDAWGSICIEISPHEPVRMAFGDWTYERMPSGRVALVRRLPDGLVLYILADGSGWGKTSPAVL